MESLGERAVWSMGGSELLATLDTVEAELARLETYRLQLIAGLDEVGHAGEIGAHDTEQLLEYRYRLDRARARRDVRLAQALPKYSAVSAALPDPADSGAAVVLRPAQAEVIVTALEKVPVTVAVEDVNVAERELVGLARHLSPAELRRAGERVRDLLDTDGPEPEEQKAYARESLTLSVADRGVKFRGYLANENAELLRSLIHAGARPHKTADGELDPRPREKRQADALTAALTVAAGALDAGTAAVPGSSSDVPGFGAKANITVTIDLEDLKSATPKAIGDTVYGEGLSAATIRRLACDARVIPLVLGSHSEPLDVGRSERLVTRAMRRALNARDKGCVVCGAPPIACDAHHLTSWIDGGTTSVDNLALLCRRHHLAIHAGEWTIAITNGQVQVARPTWADPPLEDRRRRADSARVRPQPPIPRPAPQTASPNALTPHEPATLAIWGERPAPTNLKPTTVLPIPWDPIPARAL
ncbi:DUF222 domain-containing protein [Kribbella sp. NPDC026611]|uniref:HNH endonuclease signature motif containing protein n=1 Tax=Kribbella sp. NPDC026611 TaxID=3154911 RepID=UPI0034001915